MYTTETTFYCCLMVTAILYAIKISLCYIFVGLYNYFELMRYARLCAKETSYSPTERRICAGNPNFYTNLIYYSDS